MVSMGLLPRLVLSHDVSFIMIHYIQGGIPCNPSDNPTSVIRGSKTTNKDQTRYHRYLKRSNHAQCLESGLFFYRNRVTSSLQ